MLKVDLHIHTKGDPIDDLEYTPMDIVKRAAKQNFNAIAITWHNKVFNTNSLKSYAKKKGITLIQGTELTLDGKHTLVYNVTKEEAEKITSLEDLHKLKDHTMVGAPHPYYWLPSCLGKKVKEHKEVFDFIEHSHFYTKGINFNKKAVRVARELKMPLIANSDIHQIALFGKDFTQIDAPNSAEAIIDAIKKQKNKPNKKIEAVTKPYSFSKFAEITAYFAPRGLFYFGRKALTGKG
jgi:predicted metal-dependent phosphoesterase TrpH